MQIIKVENRILWDKQVSRLVTANGSDIIIEVVGKPASGYGFITARTNGSSKAMRFDVDRISGPGVNINSRSQVVRSGTQLELVPDFKNPRPHEWKVYLSAVRVGF